MSNFYDALREQQRNRQGGIGAPPPPQQGIGAPPRPQEGLGAARPPQQGLGSQNPAASAVGQGVLNLADLVRRTVSGETKTQGPLVDVSKLFSRVPGVTGVLERLTSGTTTPQDEEAIAREIGGPVTPAVKEDILSQLISKLASGDNAVGNFARSGAGQSLLQGLQTGPLSGGALGGVLRGGEPLAPGQGPSFGLPGFGGPPAASAAGGPGGEPTTPDVAPPDPLTAGVTGDADRGMTPGTLTTRSGPAPGFTVEAAPGGGAYMRGPGGTLLGRSKIDANGNQTWEFTADPTDENINAALTAGVLTAADALKLRTDLNGLFKSMRDQEWNEINNGLNQTVAEFGMRVKAGELSLAQAKLGLEQEVAKATMQKTAVEIAAAKAQLALQPLVEREMGLKIGQMELQMLMAEQRFPLELQMLEEQLATSQLSRVEKERGMQRQAANDSYMQQQMPMLMRALGGAKAAPAAPAAPVAPGAPAPPPQIGPPPAYQELAAGAGVAPNDPNAMLAWTALLQNMQQQRA